MAKIKVGTSGADTLTGGTYSNTQLEGGLGNDTYILESYDPTYPVSYQSPVVENVNAGIDTVILNSLYSNFQYYLADNVENLTVNASDISIFGNSLNNLIISNGGSGSNDTLNGSRDFSVPGGKDTLVGGDGNDTYFVDSTDDVVTELAEQGDDQVVSAASYTMGANIEYLYLSDNNANINGTGNALDNGMTGNGGNNVLSGLAGNDSIGGNDGNDSLLGGEGNDELYGNAGKDTLDGGNGNDSLYGYGGGGEEDGDLLLGGAGDDTLFSGDSEGVADTLNGGAGNDTYEVYGQDKDVVIEAVGGGTDTVYLNGFVGLEDGYTLSANVEILDATTAYALNKVTGNASDNILIGNYEDNQLEGLAGADFLDGAEGRDTLIGGDGNDSYAVDQFGDTVVETNALPAGGIDTVYVSNLSNYTLGANVENVTLVNDASYGGNTISALGNSLNNLMIGNYVDNNLLGGAGDDTLNGGAGEDNLTGGNGNDTYIIDTAEDSVIELAESVATAGTKDKVILTSDFNGGYGGSYTLSANVEQLDASAVNESGLNLTGNNLNNTITGTAGNDYLDGVAGVDTMIGGAGADFYFVDNAGDVVTEAASADIDSVVVYGVANYTLAANVENAFMLGGVNNLTGNASNNTVFGNSGANSITGGAGNDYLNGGYGRDTLDGGAGNDTLEGGAGADELKGGMGDDLYIIASGDKITGETGGIDTVRTAKSEYDLNNVTDNGSGVVSIDQLIYTGTGQFTGTGNALANTINGGSLSDTLSGGAGNDTLNGYGGADNMIGGTGDDTYYVDQSGDMVTEVELASGGIDTIISTVDIYALAAGVEKIVLQGPNAAYAIGNSLANTITGNELDNYLDGGEDSAADTLIGGAGDDTYAVRNATDVVSETLTEANGGGQDTVTLYANINYTLGANIDDLDMRSTGNFNVTGNALDNDIEGYAGNNLLSGLDGDDDLNGNEGNDTLLGGNGNDELLGGDGSDSLVGGAGDDYLNGTYYYYSSSYTGTDTLAGGTGNDEYVVNSATDVIIEKAGEGIDTAYYVSGSGTYTLAANVEIADFSYGGGAINFTGNALNNEIHIRLDGLDTISGGLDAETGADTLIASIGEMYGYGGAIAADTSLISIENLEVTVFGGGYLNGPGTDTASQHELNIIQEGPGLKAITILGTGENGLDSNGTQLFESGALHLTGVGANVDITLQDYLRDSSRGGISIDSVDPDNNPFESLNVTLNNFSGAFEATMASGSDLNLNVTGVEESDIDLDQMDTDEIAINVTGYAAVSLDNLDVNSEVHLIDYSGDEVNIGLDAYGGLNLHLDNANTSVNIDEVNHLDLYNDSGNNALDIQYFRGGDIDIHGEDGSLSLGIDDLGGATTVNASGFDGELILDLSESSAITAIGGTGNDYFIGSNGNDTLDGGIGDDVIFGGDGNDTFVFSNIDNGIDEIIDFGFGQDHISLDTRFFTGLGADGTLDDLKFFSGAGIDEQEPGTASILYDTQTGALYYDGVGSDDVVQFASLGSPGFIPGLSAADISLFHTTLPL